MKVSMVLLLSILVYGCVTDREITVAPDKSAISGVVNARGHREVLAKRARDNQYVSPYDREDSVPESGMIDYDHLTEIFVGLIDSREKSGEVHDFTFRDDEATPDSLAIALGDTIRVHNAATRPLTFFLAATDGGGFQDLARVEPGATQRVTVKVAGRVELMTDEDQRLASHLLVRRGLHAVEVASGRNFSIDGLEPGNYGLVIWHWRVGKIERPIHLQPGKVYRVDEVLSVDRTVP